MPLWNLLEQPQSIPQLKPRVQGNTWRSRVEGTKRGCQHHQHFGKHSLHIPKGWTYHAKRKDESINASRPKPHKCKQQRSISGNFFKRKRNHLINPSMFPIISFFCQNLIIPRSIIGNRERPCLNIRRKLGKTIVYSCHSFLIDWNFTNSSSFGSNQTSIKARYPNCRGWG